jgi:hypothetical protein
VSVNLREGKNKAERSLLVSIKIGFGLFVGRIEQMSVTDVSVGGIMCCKKGSSDHLLIVFL